MKVGCYYFIIVFWILFSQWPQSSSSIISPNINNFQTKQFLSLPFLFISMLSSFSLLHLLRTLEVSLIPLSVILCSVCHMSVDALPSLFTPGKINKKVPGLRVQWATLALKFMSWVVWNNSSAFDPQSPLKYKLFYCLFHILIVPHP